MHTIAETVPERDGEGEWQWRLDDVRVKARTTPGGSATWLKKRRSGRNPKKLSRRSANPS